MLLGVISLLLAPPGLFLDCLGVVSRLRGVISRSTQSELAFLSQRMYEIDFSLRARLISHYEHRDVLLLNFIGVMHIYGESHQIAGIHHRRNAANLRFWHNGCHTFGTPLRLGPWGETTKMPQTCPKKIEHLMIWQQSCAKRPLGRLLYEIDLSLRAKEFVTTSTAMPRC